MLVIWSSCHDPSRQSPCRRGICRARRSHCADGLLQRWMIPATIWHSRGTKGLEETLPGYRNILSQPQSASPSSTKFTEGGGHGTERERVCTRGRDGKSPRRSGGDVGGGMADDKQPAMRTNSKRTATSWRDNAPYSVCFAAAWLQHLRLQTFFYCLPRRREYHQRDLSRRGLPLPSSRNCLRGSRKEENGLVDCVENKQRQRGRVAEERLLGSNSAGR